MKKLISVLLCIAMMFTFLTVISSAADGAAANGAETIFSMLVKLLSGVDWSSIMSVFTATINTLMRLFGAA